MAEPTHQPKQTIRQHREAWGWSRAVLAGRLRVSTSTVEKWELGQAIPRPLHQQRLAELFGIGVEDIALGPAE